MPNSTRLWKLLKIAEVGTPTPQDVQKKGSKILKLPPVRNWFTLAMTNKFFVIINSLKVPKIKKLLLYEMKFLVSNYSCLQNPWLGGYRPQIPILSFLCTQLNLLTPSPHEQIRGYATDSAEMFSAYTQEVNLKVFIILNLFYLRFCFGPDVCTGNFSVKICGVMPLPGSVRNIILLHTHTIPSQNFTNNIFLHTNRSLHTIF